MELIDLIENLKTHEMERKTREEKAPQKKKTLAFKSTLTIYDDDQEDDDDLSLLFSIENQKGKTYKSVKNYKKEKLQVFSTEIFREVCWWKSDQRVTTLFRSQCNS